MLTDYEEIWDRLPSSTGDQAAFRLKDPTERTGALLVSGNYFMFAADRQQPLACTGRGCISMGALAARHLCC